MQKSIAQFLPRLGFSPEGTSPIFNLAATFQLVTAGSLA